MYEHYIPFIREATAQGFVVIAPEYRGSIGYGKTFYDAIDYGGAEVDDVVTAATVLASGIRRSIHRASAIIGWSHGGMITLLSIFRNPLTFKAAVAVVPVANLFQRLASKGVEQQRPFDPQNRFGGSLRKSLRSTVNGRRVFQVDKLQIPLLVHLADNDADVTIEEGHAIDGRAARAEAHPRADEGVHEAARAVTSSTASSIRRHGSPRTRRNSATPGACLGVFRRPTWSRRLTASAARAEGQPLATE